MLCKVDIPTSLVYEVALRVSNLCCRIPPVPAWHDDEVVKDEVVGEIIDVRKGMRVGNSGEQPMHHWHVGVFPE